MRPIEIIERSWAVICIIAMLAVLASRVLFPNLSTANAEEFTGLSLYLLGQATFEVAIVLTLTLLYYVTRWTLAVRGEEVQRGPLLIVVLLASATLVWPAYQIARARYFFWTTLARESYVIQQLSRIDDLTGQMRIVDANEQASAVAKVLAGTRYASEVGYRQDRLQLTIAVSDQLSREARTSWGRRWNPVSERRMFFRLVEAVRINPQNAEAAEVLSRLVIALDRAIEGDVQLLCGNSSLGLVSQAATMSLLELEMRQSEVKAGGGCKAARPIIERSWSLGQVKCVIQQSEQARRLPADGALEQKNVGTTDDCALEVGK